MANEFGSVADTALHLQSKSSVCAAKNQEINGFQMRHVSRSRNWEDCPCGWMFPTQCKRHLTHSTHLPLLLSAWQRGRYANVLQADVPKGFWLQRGSVSRGDSRGHSTLPPACVPDTLCGLQEVTQAPCPCSVQPRETSATSCRRRNEF